MGVLHAAKSCELHVHVGGCLSPEDIIELGRDVFKDVNWQLFSDAYLEAFGDKPDPLALFEHALSDDPDGLRKFKAHFIVSDHDGGDFGRFQAKFNLIICLMRHLKGVLKTQGAVLRQIVSRHRQEGVGFVEYRCNCPPGTPDEFQEFHYSFAKELLEASQSGMNARYIISLRRWAAMEDYALVQRLMDEHPETISTIVGVDFCHVEEGFPPKALRPLFERIEQDKARRPDRALDVVYHVGESFYDKSLESSVRWCHEVADMGVKRLGHAIALGLDPAIAIARRPDAHLAELVSERLDQIDYDLIHQVELLSQGVNVDSTALENERETLENLRPDEIVQRPYDEKRLEEVRLRQRYVLDCLVKMGTVIESCPTSNLRIGGVPDPSHHPVLQFLNSGVNLAICADDPGIFGTTLAEEVDWVLTNSQWTAEKLASRLGDPRRFQLGSARLKRN